MGAIAYFISWTCYGTRVHGDERGTMDDQHNVYGTPLVASDAVLEKGMRLTMAEPPWTMSPEDRLTVRDAMNQTAKIRGWRIVGVNVRTNHIHVVVEAPDETPQHVAALFKSWATRALKASGRHEGRTKFWTNQASTVHLFTEKELFDAFVYVDGQ